MNQRVTIVPDLNQNEAIEQLANTAGAYGGAAITAVVGGLGTLLNGLFRGAVAGAQQTYANAGAIAVPVVNTAQARQQPALPAQQQLTMTPVTPGVATVTRATDPEPAEPPTIIEVTPEELHLLRQMRAGTLTLNHK